MKTRVGLIQLCCGDDPEANLPLTKNLIAQAVDQGADFVATPEVTNIVSTSRTHQNAVLQHEEHDRTLAALREQAQALGIWVLIGSLAVKTDDPDGRFANRSFMIDPNGEIIARYDKIHMFDVAVNAQETYRESAGYRPGSNAVLANTNLGPIGMTICYDMRFPHLYNTLAQHGAAILTAPSAFSPVTGQAHWHALLRARAIENGCYIIAPAQTGDHAISRGKPRSTYGHSLVVDPWGRVILDAETDVGAFSVEIDLSQVEQARTRIPNLQNTQNYNKPDG